MELERRAVLAGAVLVSVASAAAAQPSASAKYGLIGQMKAQPGKRDELIAVLLAGVSGMPGCESYVVAKDAQDADAIWITEVWQSRAAHEASLQMPSVAATIERGRPLIAGFGPRSETVPVGGVGLRP